MFIADQNRESIMDRPADGQDPCPSASPASHYSLTSPSEIVDFRIAGEFVTIKRRLRTRSASGTHSVRRQTVTLAEARQLWRNLTDAGYWR